MRSQQLSLKVRYLNTLGINVHGGPISRQGSLIRSPSEPLLREPRHGSRVNKAAGGVPRRLTASRENLVLVTAKYHVGSEYEGWHSSLRQPTISNQPSPRKLCLRRFFPRFVTYRSIPRPTRESLLPLVKNSLKFQRQTSTIRIMNKTLIRRYYMG